MLALKQRKLDEVYISLASSFLQLFKDKNINIQQISNDFSLESTGFGHNEVRDLMSQESFKSTLMQGYDISTLSISQIIKIIKKRSLKCQSRINDPINNIQPSNPSQSIVDRKSKKLLIFDLNKVLLFREARQRSFILRPHVREFMTALSPLFDIAIWTSGKRGTTIECVRSIFRGWNLGRYAREVSNDRTPHSPDLRLSFYWCQEKCLTYTNPVDSCDVHDTNSTPAISDDPPTKIRKIEKSTKPLFKKNIYTVLEHFPQYSIENTVLIDDSPIKCDINPPHTCLHPPPFLPFEIPPTSDRDSILARNGTLWNYLVALGNSPFSAQEYIQANPYNLSI